MTRNRISAAACMAAPFPCDCNAPAAIRPPAEDLEAAADNDAATRLHVHHVWSWHPPTPTPYTRITATEAAALRPHAEDLRGAAHDDAAARLHVHHVWS
jgi:hypothetical protein